MSFRPQRLGLALLSLLLPGFASAATINTLGVVDFESPTFSVGVIGGNPLYTPGQGGWGGYSPGAISDAQAHSGTQSLQTSLAHGGGLAYGGATKVLDASGGEYPYGAPFSIAVSTDWWVQAWVNVSSSGGGAQMALATGFGSCPYVQISGGGTPIVEPCTAGVPPLVFANQGANVLDQWVLLRMVHSTSMLNEFEISIIGPNVNFSAMMGYSGPPGVSAEQFLVLTGDAFWDDVSAGYGPPPPLVPEPALALLLGACAVAFSVRRRIADRRGGAAKPR